MRFAEPDPRAIFINQIRLDEHLKRMGQRAPLKVREVLAVLSYEAIERAYHANGRPPYAPRAMIGLILYGIMRGISSLRDLEALARTDVGCWWVSGGIAPDHSIIGRFIRRHEALLTQAFFEEITGQALKATHSKTTVVAGDGTVIEAAASRYRLMREEALREAATAARAAAQAAPDVVRQQRRLATLEQAQALLRSRQEGRAEHGRDPETVRIHPLEPESVVQPQKDKKLLRVSYKPQSLANEARVIVACDVHPSSETAIVPELLERAGVHGVIETSMHNAGYFSDAILECMASRGIELLCPEGQSLGKDWNKQSGKRYPKSRFIYDAEHDRYRSPGDQTLVPIELYRGNARAPGYVQYATSACAGCALKAHCTRSDEGRLIKMLRWRRWQGCATRQDGAGADAASLQQAASDGRTSVQPLARATAAQSLPPIGVKRRAAGVCAACHGFQPESGIGVVARFCTSGLQTRHGGPLAPAWAQARARVVASCPGHAAGGVTRSCLHPLAS